MINLTKELTGSLLDIGGGGEGIIGRLYTSQVTAIDNCQAELDEAPAGFQKILMDATQLTFEDNSFDHVTLFYTLMYMSANEQRRTLLEAARVLKKGGELHLWDCAISSAYPDPFCIDVAIQLPDTHITTTYGIVKQDTQSESSLSRMCLSAGFSLVGQSRSPHGFYLRFQKF